jgi:hypothetical protein
MPTTDTPDWQHMLRTMQGELISVDEAGNVALCASGDDAAALWTLEHLVNNATALRAANGRYLAVDANKQIYLSEKNAADAQLHLLEARASHVAVYADRRGFLEARDGALRVGAADHKHPLNNYQWFKLCPVAPSDSE